jgi:hypothetical protein
MDTDRYRPPEEIVNTMGNLTTRGPVLRDAAVKMDNIYRTLGVPVRDRVAISKTLMTNANGNASTLSPEQMAATVETAEIMKGEALNLPARHPQENVVFLKYTPSGVPIRWNV